MKLTPRAIFRARRRRDRQRCSCWTVARSVFWFVLIAVHGPAVWAVGRQLVSASSLAEAPLGSALALAATLAFFALKLADVRLLRLRGRWTQSVALLLVFAVAHHEAIPVDEAFFDDAAVVLTLGGVTADALQRLNPRRRSVFRIGGRLTRTLAAPFRNPPLSQRAWWEAITHRPPATQYALVEAPGRAPPLSR